MRTWQSLEVSEVVGTPQAGVWSQASAVSAPDEEIKLRRGQLFILVSAIVDQGIDGALVGKPVADELIRTYYSSLETSPLTALTNAMSQSQQKFASLVGRVSQQPTSNLSGDDTGVFVAPVLSLGAAVVWGKILYLAQSGQVMAQILRQGALKTILGSPGSAPEEYMGTISQSIASASGYLHQADVIILASTGLYKAVGGEDKLARLVNANSLSHLTDTLGTTIHGMADSAAIAGLFIRVHQQSTVTEEDRLLILPTDAKGRVDKDYLPPDQQMVSKRNWLSPLVNKLRDVWRKLSDKQRILKKRLNLLGVSESTLPTQSVYSSGQKQRLLKKIGGRKLLLLLFTIGCGGLLVFSVVVMGARRGDQTSSPAVSGAVSVIQAKLAEAKQLVELNPTRSRELLLQIRQELAELKESSQQDGNVQQLIKEVNQLFSKTFHIVTVDQPIMFVDLLQATSSASASQLIATSAGFVVFDQLNTNLISVDRSTKATAVSKLAGAKSVSGVALADNNIMLLGGGGVYRLEAGKKEAEVVIPANSGWGQIRQLQTFDNNLYLFDSVKNQIWKYLPVGRGYSAQRQYLSRGETVDLTGFVDASIDGAVWILKKDGQIVRLFAGKREAFNLSALDKPLLEPIALFTTKNTINLYLLDASNKRLVVFDKKGGYVNQYVGEVFSQVVDLVVDEQHKLIYLLAATKIYQIDLQ